MTMLRHYLDPRSLTRAVGLLAILIGVAQAATKAFGAEEWHELIRQLTGYQQPFDLIMYGATAIGLRAAIAKASEKEAK